MTKRNDSGLKYGEGSITQRGEKWYVRWTEIGADGTRKRRGRTFTDPDEAENHLRTNYRARRDGSYVPPSEITIAEIVADWLMRGESRWKPVTHATYRQRAATHVLPTLGALRAETLTTPRIQHWIDRMVKAGLNASTVDGATRILSGALREAAQIGIILRNPAVGVRRPTIKQKESTIWTDAEIARVNAVVRNEPMWRAMYAVEVTTGMRPGELRALKWGDINFEAGVIAIKRTMTKDAGGHVIVGTSTKTGSNRAVSLTSHAAAALKDWRIVQKNRQIAAERWHKEDLIFDRGDGRFLPASTWQKKHARICAAAGVPEIVFHELRHTNATSDLEAGVHPLVVSERLGHKSIQTTLDMYSHVSVDLQRAAAEALDARMFDDDEHDNNNIENA